MKKILIVGSGGQIGTELVKKLRRTYGNENVVASDLRPLTGEIAEAGPFERIDSTQIMQIVEVVKRYNIDTIYNLAAILSATAEKNPMLGWNVGIGSLVNCLETARIFNCAVFTPSSIGAFGASTPHDNTLHPLRCGYPQRPFPGLDQQSDFAWRWHYRLRRGDLLCRSKGREVLLPHQQRHLHGHDVYARRIGCHGRHHGSRPDQAGAPQLVQRDGHEL